MGTDYETATRPPSRLEHINDRLGDLLDLARYGIRETVYRVELVGVIFLRLGLLLLLGVAVAAVLSGLAVLGGALVSHAPAIADWFTTEFMAMSLTAKAGVIAAAGALLLFTGFGLVILTGIDKRSKR